MYITVFCLRGSVPRHPQLLGGVQPLREQLGEALVEARVAACGLARRPRDPELGEGLHAEALQHQRLGPPQPLRRAHRAPRLQVAGGSLRDGVRRRRLSGGN